MDNTYELYYNTGSDKDTAVLVRVVPDDLELNVVNKSSNVLALKILKSNGRRFCSIMQTEVPSIQIAL